MRHFILTLLLVTSGALFSNEANLDDYVMPADHPLQKKLCNLFNQVEFESRDSVKKEGFQPMRRAHRGLMVMSHPTVEGILFKKFMDDRSSKKEELANYIRRIDGARRLKALIEEKKLKHIVVPEKWLYPLPEEGRYILVVQKIAILRNKITKKKYGKIGKEQLKELCIVLNHLRGLDSIIANMPFTEQHKIAFIDTERWAEFRPRFLRHAMKHLSRENREYAESLKDF